MANGNDKSKFDINQIYKLMDEQPPSAEEKKLIKKAFDFAWEAHKGQRRDSGEPYFAHVFETAKNLARFNMNSKTVAAGLLRAQAGVLEQTDRGLAEAAARRDRDGQAVCATRRLRRSSASL